MGANHRVAVVTGGASGIGRAAAEKLGSRGYDVAVWDVAAATDVSSVEDGNGISIHVDVAEPGAVRDAVSATADALGPIDVLVAAAAVGGYASLTDVSDAEWERIMRINLDGVFWCLREAATHMGIRGGSITLIGSDRGVQPEPGWSPYCVSKAAVIQLGRAAALELAPRIRVNVVNPGPTDTPLLDQTRALPGVHERISSAAPLQRLAQPEEIAAAVVFCAEHPFMTGSVLTVDGGMSLAGTFGIAKEITNSRAPTAPLQ